MFALESNDVGAGNTCNNLPQNNSYPSHDLLREIREFDRVNSVQINISSCLGSQEIRNLGLDSGAYDQMITSIFEVKKTINNSIMLFFYDPFHLFSVWINTIVNL